MEDIITKRIEVVSGLMQTIRTIYSAQSDLEGAEDLLQVLKVYAEHLESRRDGYQFTATRLYNMKLGLRKARFLLEQLDEQYAAEMGTWVVGCPVTNDVQGLACIMIEVVEDLTMGIFLMQNCMEPATPGIGALIDDVVLQKEYEQKMREQKRKDATRLKHSQTKNPHLLTVKRPTRKYRKRTEPPIHK